MGRTAAEPNPRASASPATATCRRRPTGRCRPHAAPGRHLHDRVQPCGRSPGSPADCLALQPRLPGRNRSQPGQPVAPVLDRNAAQFLEDRPRCADANNGLVDLTEHGVQAVRSYQAFFGMLAPRTSRAKLVVHGQQDGEAQQRSGKQAPRGTLGLTPRAVGALPQQVALFVLHTPAKAADPVHGT